MFAPKREYMMVALLLLTSGLCFAKSPKADPKVEADIAAYDAYMAELQAKEANDPIIEPNKAAHDGRGTIPSDRKWKTPEVPEDVRDRHVPWGRITIACVVERDGHVTNTKIIRSSGYPSFDANALEALKASIYTKPATLEGKPTRAFMLVVIEFKT